VPRFARADQLLRQLAADGKIRVRASKTGSVVTLVPKLVGNGLTERSASEPQRPYDEAHGRCRAPASRHFGGSVDVSGRLRRRGVTRRARHFTVGALLLDGTFAGIAAFAAATVGATTGLFFEPLANTVRHSAGS
jgi:hypothetical protein